MITCPICDGPLDDDMAVMVDVDGRLLVICWKCEERKDAE